MKVYEIECEKSEKEKYFCSDDNLNKDDIVVIETEKGLQIGKVIGKKIKIKKNNLKPVLRKATKKDITNYQKNIKDSKIAIKKAKEIADRLNLNMKFIEATFTLEKDQLLLTFTADSRVDFRALAKELAAIYKTRIELRQIGIRDKAREVSGVGQCGRKLCCSSFLNNLESVSISMVKNQNLSLNPNKINGQCGRLLCCLTYEDNNYTNCKKGLPKVGDVVETEKGKAKVSFVDILNRRFSAITENGDKVTVKLEEKCDKCEKSNK